jgi:hypothetical protein
MRPRHVLYIIVILSIVAFFVAFFSREASATEVAFAELSAKAKEEYFNQLVIKGDAGLRAIQQKEQRTAELLATPHLSAEEKAAAAAVLGPAFEDAITAAAAIEVTPATAQAAVEAREAEQAPPEE